MPMIVPLLSSLLLQGTAPIELAIPFVEAPAEIEAVRRIEGLRSARLDGGVLRFAADPGLRISLARIERAAGAKADLARLRLTGPCQVVIEGHGSGGGKAPCLESPLRGCFSAGPFTRGLAGAKGVASARLCDMLPGGDLAWIVTPEKGKSVAASALLDALPDGHRDEFRDLVLSGVLGDGASPLPSEWLPRPRPGAVPSALAKLRWVRSVRVALARARRERKMVFLNVHHFD